jgi:hypothetical protein
VLDEIGVSFGSELPEAAGNALLGEKESAGSGKIATAAGAGGGGDPALSELEARLNNLKR